MVDALQLSFPFPSLDFEGRIALMVGEVARKLGCTTRHILDLVEEGEFSGLDLAGKKASRRYIKIPIEAYRDFIVRRMTGPKRAEFLASLPKATLRDLRREIDTALSA